MDCKAITALNSHLNSTKNINQASKDMKKTNYLFASTALAAVMISAVANAAVSISANYVGGTAPTIDSTYGTLEFALNMGGSGLTRDGIAFTTAGTTPSGTPSGNIRTFLDNGGVGSNIDVVGTGAGGNTWGTTTITGGDALFHTVAYVNASAGYTIDLTGLDAGKSYQLQFLFGDGRTGFGYTQTLTLSDLLTPTPNTTTATVTYGNGSLGDEFAMLTAVVSGSTSFRLTAPGAPILSGLAVHSIPEPSAALLGGLGLLALLRRRRA